MSAKLVAYFSASGVTAEVAKKLSQASGADLYEIEPKVAYTDDDLNWMDPSSRSSVEMKNKKSRPEIIVKDTDMSIYDTVFIGFPIWWYTAPTIVNTFLESYDFTEKNIILFATSGGSRFGKAVKDLSVSAPGATITEGKILNGVQTVDGLKEWLHTL